MEKMETTVETMKHQARMAQRLNADRFADSSVCDLTINTGRKKIWVHKSVLAVSSHFFKTMLTMQVKGKHTNEIVIREIPPDRLSNIVDYIYTGKIYIDEKNMIDILADAEYTQLEELKLLCSEFMQTKISVTNCLKLLGYAQQYKLNDVIQTCKETISSNFEKVIKKTDILNYDEITSILKLKRNTPLLVKCNHQCLSVVFAAYAKVVQEQSSTSKKSQMYRLPHDLSMFCLDEIMVIGGGRVQQDCVTYDVISKHQTQIPKLTCCRTHATSVKVRRIIYVIGGENPETGEICSSCEFFDLDDPAKWNIFSNMLKPRHSCGSAYRDGYIFVTGGFNANGTLSSCEKYDIHDESWSKMANMLHRRLSHGTAICNDSLYCIGGYNGRRLKTCERCDLTNGNWTEIAPLQQARNYFCCVELNGFIYAIGGLSSNAEPLETVERYSPDIDKWQFIAPLQKARRGSAACIVGNKIFVIGGSRRNGITPDRITEGSETETIDFTDVNDSIDVDVDDGEYEVHYSMNHNKKLKLAKKDSLLLNTVEVYDPRVDAWSMCFKTKSPVYGATAQPM